MESESRPSNAPEPRRLTGPTILKQTTLGFLRNEGDWDIFECLEEEGRRTICKMPYGSGEYSPNPILVTITKPYIKEASMYKYLGNRIPGLPVVREIGSGYIKMDYSGEPLADKIKDMVQSGNRMPLSSVLSYMYQILTSLNLLKKEYISHLGLTPEVITIGEDGKITIGSFDRAILLSYDKYSAFENVARGTVPVGVSKGSLYASSTRKDLEDISKTDGSMNYNYSAPENFFIGDKTGAKPMYPAADIWSAGAIFYEMLTGYRFSTVSLSMEDGKVKVDKDRRWIDRATKPLDFAGIITREMMKDEFQVYDKNWDQREQVVNIEDQNPKGVAVNKTSPYNAILERYPEEEYRKTLDDIWALLVNMLNPNPLSRYTAEICLASPVFSDLRGLRGNRDPVYIPPKREDIDLVKQYNARYAKYFSDLAQEMTFDPTPNSSYEKAFRKYPRLSRRMVWLIGKLDPFIDEWFGLALSWSETSVFSMYFAMFIVANYIEYGHVIDTLNGDIVSSQGGVDYLKEVETLRNNNKFRNSYISKLIPVPNIKMETLQDMIYSSVYYLLINVLELKFWEERF